jgi:hypothetical protein
LEEVYFAFCQRPLGIAEFQGPVAMTPCIRSPASDPALRVIESKAFSVLAELHVYPNHGECSYRNDANQTLTSEGAPEVIKRLS